MNRPEPGGTAAPGRRHTTHGFGTRLLVAQTLVLVGGAISAWVVAAAVAPGLFHEHLRRAGAEHSSTEAAHVEQAFTSAMIISLIMALVLSVLMALAVSWFFTRRVQRSITAVAESAEQIAAGRYGARLPGPGLGREFDQLAATVNRLAQRLDAVESTRRRMLSDLAHEMRTPLATLDAHLEALEDGVRALDAETMAVLRSSTRRLGRLAQDIDAVSRAEEGQLRIAAVPTDTRTLIAAAIGSARDRFTAKGVTLGEHVAQNADVAVDPERLGQVLGNLLDNALRHTPAGGTVTVDSARVDDRWVEIGVEDTGEGIAAEHLAHLFDRFYRADSARGRRNGGSGIGLTIARALVEAHGGRIRAHSPGPGRGARFSLCLPVADRRDRQTALIPLPPGGIMDS